MYLKLHGQIGNHEILESRWGEIASTKKWNRLLEIIYDVI